MDTQSETTQKSALISPTPYHQISFAATRSQFGSVKRFLLDNGFQQRAQNSCVAQHCWYDTPTLWYYHAGATLKTSHPESGASLLSLRPLDDSGLLSSITTLNQPIRSPKTAGSLLSEIPPGIVRDYLIGSDAPLNIEPVGSLQLTIEIIELNQSDKGAMQLVFEQEYHKRAKGLLWLRVEPGAADVGGPLDERLGRRCALTSVAGVDRERLQRLLKSRVVSKATKKSPPAKGAVPPLVATIESILVKLSAQLHQTLDGTRLGVSDEPLHDFRITCQQIRVMLTLFSPPLIRTGALQSAIRELRTVLGVVRDCDVFLSRQGLGGIEPKLLQGVLHQRATARHELLKALQPTRIEPLLESIDLLSRSSGSWLSEGFIVARGFGQRLLAAERFGVRRSVERCRAFGHPQTLHSVRKSIKRARYATEWLGGKGSVRELKRYKALQKELGIFHDAIVAIDRLRGLGDDCGVGLREIEQRVGPLEQISREAQERFWLLWQKWFEP